MSATRELDEAQRRMETGWKVVLLSDGQHWKWWLTFPGVAIAYATESEAFAAYLAVTRGAMSGTAQTTSHQTPKSDVSRSE
jgi:hypothetical protein